MRNQFYKGKSILITGASRGIGLAMLKKLSIFECNITACARNITEIEKINNTPANIKFVKCDVTNKEEVKNAFNTAVASFSTVDVAILNAGAGGTAKLDEFSSETAEKIINTNLMGIIYFLEHLLPLMTKSKQGVIAGVSSLADARGYETSGLYCASKIAVTRLLESLSIEAAPKGISIITVKPGFVKTDMTAENNFKMPFLMEPEKAADIILNGIAKNKRYITFPFATTFASKLAHLLPNTVFEYLSKKIKFN